MSGYPIILRNFPTAWVDANDRELLRTKARSLLERFGDLEQDTQVFDSADGILYVTAAFRTEDDADEVLQKLQNFDIRSKEEKEADGGQGPRPHQVFHVERTLAAPSQNAQIPPATTGFSDQTFPPAAPTSQPASHDRCRQAEAKKGNKTRIQNQKKERLPPGANQARPSEEPRGSSSSSQFSQSSWEFDSGSNPQEKVWASFLLADAIQIERAWQQWRDSRNPQDKVRVISVSMGEREYLYNFQTMQQTNVQTGRVRELRRNGMPAQRAEDSSVAASSEVTSKEVEMRVEINSLKQQLASLQSQLNQRKSQECATSSTVLSEMELWKTQRTESEPTWCPRPHLVPAIQDLLRALVPHDHHSRCDAMRRVVVTKVCEVANVGLMQQYKFRKQRIRETISTHHDCPWVSNELVPEASATFSAALEHIKVDAWANELLLLHGTTQANANHILQQGFDDRLSGTIGMLYGTGVYFTSNSCKAMQYCNNDAQGGCIFIARVVLGHPYMARGPMRSHKRPPRSSHGSPHDSVIARPGIANGLGIPQTHWEFVVPDDQIYPELCAHITFEA